MKIPIAISKIEKIIGKRIVKIGKIHSTGYATNDDGDVVSVSIYGSQFSDDENNDENITSIFRCLASLPYLSELVLYQMKIRNISLIENLSSLTILNLRNNLIEDITPLSALKNLQHLDLESNKILNIRPLKGLTRLELLKLGYNNIEDLSPLQELINIKRLWLHHNNISNLICIDKLVNLNLLWLDHNKISYIKPLKKLYNLKKLWLNDNQIYDISAVENLTNLDELYLSNNRISEIKYIQSLHNLFNLDLSGNPIQSPSPEVIRRGIASIQNWFKANKKPLNEIKILLIGDPNAGKTSLCKRLKDNTYQPGQNQTDGIVIETFRFGEMDTFKDQKKLKDITAYVWDFGGQEIIGNAHRFFMTNRSVYLLVMEARSDVDADKQVREWMQWIIASGGNSPVIVIINKIELNKGFGLDEATLKKEFPQIRDFVKISCAFVDKEHKSGNIEKVKEALENWIPEAEFFETQFDVRWITLKEELQKETTKKTDLAEKKYRLNHDEFIQACRRNRLHDKLEQEEVINFLNDLGVLLHFNELELTEYYVLDPYWVTTGVYRIITSQLAAQKLGEIAKKELPKIVNEEPVLKAEMKHLPEYINYTDNECLYIANIMRYFQLCYFMNDGEKILIPDLLSKETPLKLTSEFIDERASEKIALAYTYEYLPNYIMPRFIVSMKDDIHRQWRTGVILHNTSANNVKGLVITNAKEERIQITVTGGNRQLRKEYLAIIRHKLERINQRHNVQPKLQVLLPGLDGLTVDYEELMALQNAQPPEDIYKKFSNKIFHEFKISELINGILSEEDMAKKFTKRITVFLASSMQLKEEREQLELMFGRYNHNSMYRNLYVQLGLCDDMSISVSINGKQEDYNKAIRACDMLIVLYDKKVGKYTWDEFETGFGQYVKTMERPDSKPQPIICVLAKEKIGNFEDQTPEDYHSVQNFEMRLRELKHYRFVYRNTDHMLFQVRLEIERIFQEL